MGTIAVGETIEVLAFIISLATLIILYGIVRRTKEDIRQGFLSMLAALIFFIIFEILKITYVFSNTPLLSLLTLLFILFLLFGMWKIRTVIISLSEFGQIFVLTSEKTHDKKLVSLIKNVRGICYLTLEKPCTIIENTLKENNIDTSDIYFIDGTGEKCKKENCTHIKNDPEEIKKALTRVLKEKKFRCVIIDNINAVKKIEDYQLPEFIQDIASLIKSNETQGFFIGKSEKLKQETINDISMLVDKVIG